MSFYSELIENYMEDKVKLPKRLKKFFKEEYEAFEGKYVSGLPNYSEDSRLPLSFNEDNLESLFEEHVGNDLADEEDRFKYLPLASLDDAQYMAVCITDENCPVYMWEHEDGEFHEHSPSLDEFLEGLHDTDSEGDDANDNLQEIERKRREKLEEIQEGPTYHKFDDHDKTPQGQKAIALGIHNNRTGAKETYDYTKAEGADLSWLDYDPSKIGNLEPWLCYGPNNEGGWIDLNEFPNGAERRARAAYRQLGFPKETDEKLQTVTVKSIAELERILGLNDKELAAEARKLKMKSSNLYSHRDFILGMKIDFEKILAKHNEQNKELIEANDQFIAETNKALKKQMNSNIAAAKEGGLLDPVKGVSMEDWAAANAKIMGGMALNDILKVLGVEKPIWDEVSAEWNARMSRDSTFAISTVYGNAFVDSNIGKFASAGNGGESKSNGAVEKVKNDFELYVKIMCHQSVGSAHGLDANAVLKQYGLDAADWGVLGAYWSPKMVTTEFAMKMTTLMEKYNAEFAKGAPAKAGDDIEF